MKRFILRAFARALDSIAVVGRILAGQPSGSGVTLFGYWRMKRNSERDRRLPVTPVDSAPIVAQSRTLGNDSSAGDAR
jgi:hypothetical protein